MIDFNLDGDYPIKYDEADLILQQVDILFDTTPGEVLGDISYGTNYSTFLYNLQLSNNDIKYTIEQDLNKLELFNYTYTVDVNILMGSENDIILVNITFTNPENQFNKTYKIVK
jgi:hypothetical protein